jgi:hypothetical protein
LNISDFGPFKNMRIREVQNFDLKCTVERISHFSRNIESCNYDIFTFSDIISGFASSGVFIFNSYKFTHIDFAGYIITDGSVWSGRVYKKFWEELIAHFPWYDKGQIENDASNNSSVVACLFVTAVTFLPSRCLAIITGFLPSRCLATLGDTQTHTQKAAWSHKLTFLILKKKIE